MTKEIIVLDTETTGVNAREDSLIEIAAVKVVGGQITDRFQTLVKPIKSPLNTTVSVLTGIKPEDLVAAPDISEIKDKLLEFVGELPITGHNISFDLDFLKANGIDPLGHSLDTLDLVIAVLPKLPYHSMQFLAQYFKLPAQPSHRAMDDVLATTDLINVIISYVQNLPQSILKNVKEVLDKSDWEWSWVFDTSGWQTFTPPNLPLIRGGEVGCHPEPPLRHPELDSGSWAQIPGLARNDVLDKISDGLNLYELSPDIPQIPANIALASEDKQSVLVVSNNVFNQTDWAQHNLNPQFGSTVQLDVDRFQFLLDKPKLKSTEAKLLIKVLLTGYPEIKFDPHQVYLSRDEYYLWEQKLTPFQFQITPPNLPLPRGGEVELPVKAVLNFSTLWEILENDPNLLKNRTLYLPQWLEFTDWALFKSVKIFTELYLHAAVSSRRDYVHDFVDDNKQADEMFKLLNNFGTQTNSLWESIRQLWKTAEADKTIEINDMLVGGKAGKEVAKFADQAVQTLTKFLDKVKSAPAHPSQIRQIEHTQKLIEHLQTLSGTTEHKIYLEGYLDRVTVYIVKFPIANIWQTPPKPLLTKVRKGGVGLKDFKTVVASNSLIASGSDDFMVSIFGESITISELELERVSGSAGQLVNPPSLRHSGLDPESRQENKQIKPINIVKSLPDRKAPDYEDKVFDYLRQNLQPNEKVLVVFSNNPQVGIFFEKYYQQISGVDLISYNVAGNSEMLADKLAHKSGFALLVSNSNLAKYIKSVQALDRVIFLTMPFDPPGTLGQVLATTKLKNDFTDYSLPRAVLKFKQALSDLDAKTNEFLILDSRLVNANWASPILTSLNNFQITEI